MTPAPGPRALRRDVRARQDEDDRMNPVDRPPALVRWTLRLEETTGLDAPVQAIEPKITSLFGSGTRGAALRGQWLGHALHPLLTDLVMGSWTSATVLDLFGGRDSARAAQRLVATGLLAAGPTAWTGWRSAPRSVQRHPDRTDMLAAGGLRIFSTSPSSARPTSGYGPAVPLHSPSH